MSTEKVSGRKLPRHEEAALPALVRGDKRPDEEVLEEGGFRFDIDRHFLQILPRFIQDRVASLPHYWWSLSEAEIIEKAWPEQKTPDETTSRLRISLWDGYDRCFRFKLSAIDMEAALRGICTLGYLRNRVLENPGKVAFLCTPPSIYENQVKELHQKGISELKKILELPMILKDGTPDAKIADVKRRIYESLDMRLKGAVIQRIDQRTVNVNVDGDRSMLGGDQDKPDELLSMEEINAQLQQLTDKSAALSVPGTGRPVEVVDVAKDSIPEAEIVEDARPAGAGRQVSTS